jgi:hypothetical protein
MPISKGANYSNKSSFRYMTDFDADQPREAITLSAKTELSKSYIYPQIFYLKI